MATINIAVAYPDGQGARIMAALKGHIERGTGVTPTNAEVMAWVKARIAATIHDTVRQFEATEAAKAAIAEAQGLPLDIE